MHNFYFLIFVSFICEYYYHVALQQILYDWNKLIMKVINFRSKRVGHRIGNRKKIVKIHWVKETSFSSNPFHQATI